MCALTDALREARRRAGQSSPTARRRGDAAVIRQARSERHKRGEEGHDRTNDACRGAVAPLAHGAAARVEPALEVVQFVDPGQDGEGRDRADQCPGAEGAVEVRPPAPDVTRYGKVKPY